MHRLVRTQCPEIRQPRGCPRDLADRLRVQSRGNGRIAPGAETRYGARIEQRLRGAQLETPDIERVGDPGGDGDSELIEVDGLPGDRSPPTDGGKQIGPPLAGASLGGAHVQLRDRRVDPLPPTEGDSVEQGYRPGRRPRLLRAEVRGESDRETEDRQRSVAHHVDLMIASRGARARR